MGSNPGRLPSKIFFTSSKILQKKWKGLYDYNSLIFFKGGKTSPTVVEYITLPCLKILHGLMRGSTQQLGKPDDKSDTPQATLTPFEGEFSKK